VLTLQAPDAPSSLLRPSPRPTRPGLSSGGSRWRWQARQCPHSRIARLLQRLRTSRNLQCVAGRATACFKGCTRRERCVMVAPRSLFPTRSISRVAAAPHAPLPLLCTAGPMAAHHRALLPTSFSIDETRSRTVRVSNTRRGGRASVTIRWRGISTRGALIRTRPERRGGALASRLVCDECGSLACLVPSEGRNGATLCQAAMRSHAAPPSTRRIRRGLIVSVQFWVKANDASDSHD
jgi:hypothetical protein